MRQSPGNRRRSLWHSLSTFFVLFGCGESEPIESVKTRGYSAAG